MQKQQQQQQQQQHQISARDLICGNDNGLSAACCHSLHPLSCAPCYKAASASQPAGVLRLHVFRSMQNITADVCVTPSHLTCHTTVHPAHTQAPLTSKRRRSWTRCS